MILPNKLLPSTKAVAPIFFNKLGSLVDYKIYCHKMSFVTIGLKKDLPYPSDLVTRSRISLI
jgi:hypothetical protein